MQLSHDASKCGSVACCAMEVLDAVPPVIWFIRSQMRNHRKGLSLPQFRTLSMVDRQPAASLSVVAEHLGASLSTASRIVGGMVDKGLLKRAACNDDRRQIALAITQRGRNVLAIAWSATLQQMQAELGRLPDRQRAIVAEAMGIFKNTFGSSGLPQRIECAGKTHAEALESTSKIAIGISNVPPSRRHKASRSGIVRS